MDMDFKKVIYVNNANKVSYSCLDDLLTNTVAAQESNCECWRDEYYINYYLVSNLEYSKYYRKLIKDNAVEDLLKILSAESQAFAKYIDLDKFSDIVSLLKTEMADFVIEQIPVDTVITVNGETYNGADGLEQASRDETMPVSNLWQRYPCFDSFDYATEKRCYNNYCFCTKDSALWSRIKSLNNNMNYCLVGENTPKDILPIVYLNGDADTMLYAHL